MKLKEKMLLIKKLQNEVKNELKLWNYTKLPLLNPDIFGLPTDGINWESVDEKGFNYIKEEWYSGCDPEYYTRRIEYDMLNYSVDLVCKKQVEDKEKRKEEKKRIKKEKKEAKEKALYEKLKARFEE